MYVADWSERCQKVFFIDNTVRFRTIYSQCMWIHWKCLLLLVPFTDVSPTWFYWANSDYYIRLFFTYTLVMCKFYIQTGTQTILIGLCCIKTCQWLSVNCSWSGILNSYPITTNTIRLRKLYLWLLAWINLIFHIKIRSFGFLGSQMPRLKYQGFWAMFLRF